MKDYNWRDFKKANETKELGSLSMNTTLDSVQKNNEQGSRKGKAKHTWFVYVTPEINDKVSKLMAKHRWNRTQALNYIFEVFFSKENLD